jgi:hypothetical protein
MGSGASVRNCASGIQKTIWGGHKYKYTDIKVFPKAYFYFFNTESKLKNLPMKVGTSNLKTTRKIYA